jgi:CRISPR-associated protein Cas2
MLINASQERAVLDVIRRNRPAKGIVQVLSVTEKQFSKIEFITGEYHTDVVTGDERLVIL